MLRLMLRCLEQMRHLETGIRCGHTLTTLTTDTPGGVAWNKIADVKHEQLPQVVMAKDFDAAWDTYMDAYNACHPEDFISELQTELDTRMEQAAKFK